MYSLAGGKQQSNARDKSSQPSVAAPACWAETVEGCDALGRAVSDCMHCRTGWQNRQMRLSECGCQTSVSSHAMRGEKSEATCHAALMNMPRRICNLPIPEAKKPCQHKWNSGCPENPTFFKVTLSLCQIILLASATLYIYSCENDILSSIAPSSASFDEEEESNLQLAVLVKTACLCNGRLRNRDTCMSVGGNQHTC